MPGTNCAMITLERKNHTNIDHKYHIEISRKVITSVRSNGIFTHLILHQEDNVLSLGIICQSCVISTKIH